MGEIRVSVLISAYNIEKYIGECIESVQRQNLDGIEIICVDDCSTDGTVAVIKDYMAKDDRIILIEHKENGGPARARNTGCRRAKGKYIYFIDGDDYIIEGALQKLYGIAEENNLDLLSFSGEAFVDKGFEGGAKYESRRNSYKRRTTFDRVYTGPELFAAYMDRGENNGNLYLQFIRREFYVGNNLYANDDLKYDNDSPFGIYMHAERAMCIPDVFYMRRFRPNSRVTSKNDFEKAECIMLRFALELEHWNSLNLSEQLNRSMERYFLTVQSSMQSMLRGLDRERLKFSILNKYPAIKYMMEYFIMNKSIYEGLPDDLLDSLANEQNVVLYGAGIVAENVAELLERHGMCHYSVVVTRKESDDQKFRNKEVVEVSQWQGNWSSAIVIVAVKAPSAVAEIKASLQSKECRKIILP